MSNYLSQKDLDKMFQCFCEKQTVLSVAKKCSISPTTVRKYKKLKGWDARLKTVQKKAVEKGNESLATVLAENLKFAKYAKNKVIELMQVGGKQITCPHCKEKLNIPGGEISKNPIADLDRMIRLELLLRGEADSRTEVKPSRLSDVPTDELLKMREEINSNGDK